MCWNLCNSTYLIFSLGFQRFVKEKNDIFVKTAKNNFKQPCSLWCIFFTHINRKSLDPFKFFVMLSLWSRSFHLSSSPSPAPIQQSQYLSLRSLEHLCKTVYVHFNLSPLFHHHAADPESKTAILETSSSVAQSSVSPSSLDTSVVAQSSVEPASKTTSEAGK